MTIDIERVKRAAKDIHVEGRPCEKLIAVAIAAIQADGSAAMRSQYFGIKNYASFGDQREDHQYGMGPRHGNIVFRIGRNDREHPVTLGDDHVYLLECIRDFGLVACDRLDGMRYPSHGPERLNLLAAISRLEHYEKHAAPIRCALEEATVDSHEQIAPALAETTP